MFDNLAKISKLKGEIVDLNTSLTQAREARDEAEIALSRQQTNHRVELEDERNSRTIAVNRLENEKEALEKSIPLKVAKEVAAEKKELKARGEKQDREHADRMRKLETEHAAKISKCDRDLEAEKVSYRKYLRSEFNSKVEALEKDNKRLFTENATLAGKNTGLETTVGILESQIESVTEFADSVAADLGTLSGKIAEGLVKSTPTITADFSTPETPENHVHVEVPGTPAKGGNQGGGGNKDNK